MGKGEGGEEGGEEGRAVDKLTLLTQTEVDSNQAQFIVRNGSNGKIVSLHQKA